MIKINLLEEKKPFKMPIILGIDFSQINLRLVAAAIIISYLPETFIYPDWEEERKKEEVNIKRLNKSLKKLKRVIRKNSKAKLELEAFNKQVEILRERKNYVTQIVNLRSNPRKLLERLARNTPTDLWFEYLKIDGDRNIEILGSAFSYKDIGDFIISANESQFFGKTLSLTDSSTKKEKIQGTAINVEKYKIEGKIQNF
ncbi:PilN domain-containing protein [Bacteriovoracales bacterium]|nr:PilN domain-containing protein [Bacteriovoracales bacterium]